MKVITNELIPVYETDQGERVVDARELHSFLEVGKDFTTWIKDRIEKYNFDEGIDYDLTLTKIGERQNVTRHDYILKIDMAKEIAMLEGNEQGKKVRKYFIAIETRARSMQSIDVALLTPEMQMFKQIWDAQAIKQIEDKQRDEKISKLETGITTIQETIVHRADNWRDSINKMFNAVVKNSSGKDYSTMRNESYSILEERAKCDLAKRQRNMKERLADSGATKTKINSITRIDVIEADQKLKEIYTAIVKEMSVRSMKME